MNRLLLATGCCLALVLSACDKPNQAAQTDGPANTDSLPALPTSAPPRPALAASDQAFMAKAAGDNAFQIAMARLALQKSQTDRVRKLARTIMDDHTRMNNELAAIATRRGTEHASPPVPVGKARQLQEHLATLQGDAFDRAFAGVMVNDHHVAIDLFSAEAKDGHDDAVKAFARKELPTLQEHLAMASALDSGHADAMSK